MVVDPTGWPRFFVGAAVDSPGRLGFRVVVGLAIGQGRADGLAIGGAVLTGREVTVGFSGLFLW